MKKKCEACGVQFNAAKSRIRTCSRECGAAIRRGPAREVERACRVCGVTYTADATRLGFGRQTTCSRACSYKLRAEQKREPRLGIACATCGEEFSRPPSQIKAKHGAHFCSRACHFAGRALGLYRPEEYRHTDAGRAAQRKAGAHAYASGRSIQWPEIENVIAAMLREAGHVVIQQHIVSDGGHFWPVDLFVPALLAVVEIDGPEHADPDKAERDRRVDAECARLGLRVVRVADGPASDVRKAVFRALADAAV